MNCHHHLVAVVRNVVAEEREKNSSPSECVLFQGTPGEQPWRPEVSPQPTDQLPGSGATSSYMPAAAELGTGIRTLSAMVWTRDPGKCGVAWQESGCSGRPHPQHHREGPDPLFLVRLVPLWLPRAV